MIDLAIVHDLIAFWRLLLVKLIYGSIALFYIPEEEEEESFRK
jgi:hypothetical protein